jgi:Cytochrome oxidase complex assembly protein 1
MGTSTGAAMPSSEPRKNWFQRNWKWFVPSGCLTLIVLFLAFIAGIFAIVEGSFKSSTVYAHALAQANANSHVSETMGKPLKPGWFISGSISVAGDSGDADISIPISGPKGKGTVYVVAKKTEGAWQYQTLQVEVDGHQDRIDLLKTSPGG